MGDAHVRRTECIRKSPWRYDPGFGASREWNNESVASIIYMIQDGDINSNVNMDDILSLMSEWDAEYFMDAPLIFHMR